jgi:DNA-binding response OmpR family regulator
MSAPVLTKETTLSDQPLVLVVEDEYLLQTDVEEALNSGGFAAKTVSSGEAALTLFADGGAEKYNALITDVRLSGGLDDLPKCSGAVVE